MTEEKKELEKEEFNVSLVIHKPATMLVSLSQLFNQAVDDEEESRQLNAIGKEGMSYLLQNIADEVTDAGLKIEEKFKEGVYIS